MAPTGASGGGEGENRRRRRRARRGKEGGFEMGDSRAKERPQGREEEEREGEGRCCASLRSKGIIAFCWMK